MEEIVVSMQYMVLHLANGDNRFEYDFKQHLKIASVNLLWLVIFQLGFMKY